MKTKKVITHCSPWFFWLIFPLILVMVTPLLAQTPVAYWKLEEGYGATAVDSSGNAHTAHLSNGVAWIKGIDGGGISANAADEGSLSIPTIDLHGTRAVTIAFWAKRTYSTAGDDVLFEATGNYQDSTTGFVFLPDDEFCHGIQVALRGNEGKTANCYSQPSSGVWHHLAVVLDKGLTGGSEVAFYVDGVLQTPSWSVYASTNTNDFGNNPIYLFSRGGTADFSSGDLGDLRVYNRALTTAQIQQIYDGSMLGGGLAVERNQICAGQLLDPPNAADHGECHVHRRASCGRSQRCGRGMERQHGHRQYGSDSKGNVYTRAVGPTIVRAATCRNPSTTPRTSRRRRLEPTRLP